MHKYFVWILIFKYLKISLLYVSLLSDMYKIADYL